jgi:hypothetical protein
MKFHAKVVKVVVSTECNLIELVVLRESALVHLVGLMSRSSGQVLQGGFRFLRQSGFGRPLGKVL